MAKPADLPSVTTSELTQYLQSHDILVPDLEFHHDIADIACLPYFNSGVIVLNCKWRVQFVRAWARFNQQLLNNSSDFSIDPFHVDQASLSAAILAEKIPIQPLPTAMNFPAHFPADRYPNSVWEVDPIIIHYHRLFEYNGFIKSLPTPRASLRGKMFNAKLHAERGCRIGFKPPEQKEGPKVIVGTGWWSSNVSSPWSIGSDAIRTSDFFDIWHRQVTKCISPAEIIVTDSHSPLKPLLADYPNVQWVELDMNYGHPNDVRTGKVKTKFSGYTRSVINGAMYAFCCDADYFVYVEQDCLVRGDNFLSHGYLE